MGRVQGLKTQRLSPNFQGHETYRAATPGEIAQLVERILHTDMVAGSIPAFTTIFNF
jgi:hypothetical protein